MRFILIDEILEMTPGQTIRGIKAIDGNEDYFPDHFPGFPVVPGVILTEMMAQTAGKCLDAENPQRGKSMLAQITDARFREWVRPGQLATIHARIISSRPTFATAKCRIEVGQRDVCSAELLFSFLKVDELLPGYRDEVLERFLNRPVKTPTAIGTIP